MKFFSNWSSQVIAGLGSLAVSGVLMAYAIVPASPSIVPVMA
ncbi:enoyl-CoA hydratase [Altererythrobacter sp. MTPC7]|nr:enoyl-CoA hydratase [Erythrobacteraceae bacterium WH01K]